MTSFGIRRFPSEPRIRTPKYISKEKVMLLSFPMLRSSAKPNSVMIFDSTDPDIINSRRSFTENSPMSEMDLRTCVEWTAVDS